jgi:hypothetical protein
VGKLGHGALAIEVDSKRKGRGGGRRAYPPAHELLSQQQPVVPYLSIQGLILSPVNPALAAAGRRAQRGVVYLCEAGSWPWYSSIVSMKVDIPIVSLRERTGCTRLNIPSSSRARVTSLTLSCDTLSTRSSDGPLLRCTHLAHSPRPLDVASSPTLATFGVQTLDHPGGCPHTKKIA